MDDLEGGTKIAPSPSLDVELTDYRSHLSGVISASPYWLLKNKTKLFNFELKAAREASVASLPATST